jgi:acetyl-CoA carboxylase carboxyltransferase component
MSSMPAGSGGQAAGLDADAQAEVERVQQSGPWDMAAGMTYDDVIDPRELRNALIQGLDLAEARRAEPGIAGD